MKLAITGKGGVGKTTLSTLLTRVFLEEGKKVLAIDADPDANLAAALGFAEPEKIVPMAQMKELIEERTGAKVGTMGSMFKLNPKVDDIPEKYFARKGNVKFMRMGGIQGGGQGCACPENTFLKTLLDHLLLERDEVVILDMEAGIEHLGRGTARAVDALIIVVEPGRRSIETALRIGDLAADLSLRKLYVVGSKIRKESDWEYVKEGLPGFVVLGYIPYDEGILESGMGAEPQFSGAILQRVRDILAKIQPN
jgi:CO dehydrogenase maturation factor